MDTKICDFDLGVKRLRQSEKTIRFCVHSSTTALDLYRNQNTEYYKNKLRLTEINLLIKRLISYIKRN